MSGFVPKLLEDIGHRLAGTAGPGPQFEYIWNHSYLSPLAMAEFPPPSDFPAFDWLLKVGERVVEAAANAIALDADSATKTAFQAKAKALKDSLQTRTVNLPLLREVVSDITQFGAVKSSDRPGSIEDYARLFRVIGLPAVSSDYNQDATFAAMRTAGPNPLIIRRIRKMNDNFPLSEQQFQFVMPGDSLEAALAEGRVYLCDYAMLDILKVDAQVSPLKYPYVPMALFCTHRNTGALLPVAIQTQQTPQTGSGPSNLFLADGSPGWLIAKTIVEMADGNVHEAVSHLGRTHLFIEPFVVATGRNLTASHPVCKLLWPHFEGTLFINFAAVFTLLAKGGAVDSLLNGTIDSVKQLTATDLVKQYPFNNSLLPDTLGAGPYGRDVMDLKGYAYRDDALQYWNTIHAWVHDYLGNFYANDQAVLNDIDLQRWCLDLISQDGGRVAGFGINNQIPTVAYLEQALTMIIFTSSVQHAAVNYPQYDLMSYCPNMPLAAYSQFPQEHPAGAQQYLDMLPTMSRATLQMQVGFVLGSVHYTELGAYPANYFSGKAAQQLVTFQGNLNDVNSAIQEKNAIRRPYWTLLRASIPQSINI